ncbi:MAG TPA: hypothetical protein VFR85_02350 [Anaeromyxobacteraceae bacterium]|nr:hypothetical protein [Anaeromyxobacteraceae bacterium]
MRTARAAIAIAALAFAQGCGTSCEDLADRICGCLFEGPTRDACTRQVEAQLKRDPKPDASAEAYCESKLATCQSGQAMCDALTTCQGKVNCGLAYPDPADPTGATCLPEACSPGAPGCP